MNVSTLAIRLLLFCVATSLSGCQLSYLATGAKEQIKILRSRTPISKVLNSSATDETTRSKLLYAQQAKDFAKSIGLACDENFKTYVELNRPYVSFLLVAAEKERLKAKTWWFPIVGSFPYKGFFSKKAAAKAQTKWNKKGYDTYVRGVTAYSSLGWFKEPILSSMLLYSKEGLAETVFHECFHSTYFIKNQTPLNERLAVFFAHKILIEFLHFQKQESQIKYEKDSWKDQHAFSLFLEKVFKQARLKYKQKTSRKEIFQSIQEAYLKELKPKLKVLSYDSVFLENLNNAKLIAKKTYFHDFSNLEEAFEKTYQSDIKSFLQALKTSKPKDSILKTLSVID